MIGLARKAIVGAARRQLRSIGWHDVLDQAGIFVPNSRGAPEPAVLLSLQAARDVWPALAQLSSRSRRPLPVVSAEEFCSEAKDRAAAKSLEELFNKYGSDKATLHNYHLVYGRILRGVKVSAMLEIGLGTNNEDVISHMGRNGRPGASLRAFRDYLAGAAIYGADVDRRILFEEERIQTHFVDQTAPSTLVELGAKIATPLDVIIDDGLHTPNANLNVLLFALDHLSSDGWFVIEDIPPPAAQFWQVVDHLMPSGYETYLVDAADGMLYVGRKRATRR